ncbi:MAG: phosphate transport system regulatory protein PhoU [Chloroflexi bacterium]|nr:MAG: phosphate transport system regulatory protein PhoU [Chloroflexota bacterium]
MPRETFDRELQRLQDEMLVLASMVESVITDSVEVLKQRDMEGSRRLIAHDRVINKKRYQLEADCLVAIATQQPMASDLRILAAILNITSELERIGDYAKGIARINLMIGEGPLLKPLIDVPLMAEKARDMLHQALDAFVQRDVELARRIPNQDDEVDRLYDQVYRELIDYIIADQSNTEQANYLLWVAHNLERAADRVTNICERVIFTVTGQIVELDVDNSGLISLS